MGTNVACIRLAISNAATTTTTSDNDDEEENEQNDPSDDDDNTRDFDVLFRPKAKLCGTPVDVLMSPRNDYKPANRRLTKTKEKTRAEPQSRLWLIARHHLLQSVWLIARAQLLVAAKHQYNRPASLPGPAKQRPSGQLGRRPCPKSFGCCRGAGTPNTHCETCSFH